MEEMFRGEGIQSFIQKLMEKKKWRNKLLPITILLISIPLILYILFTYTHSLGVVKKEKIDTSERLLLKASQSIRYSLSGIYETTNEISNHNGIQKAIVDYKDLEERVQGKISKFIEEQFDKAKSKSSYIKQMFIVTEEGKVFSGTGEYVLDGEALLESEYYKELNTMEDNGLWVYEKTPKIFPEKDKGKIFFYLENIKSKDGEGNAGVIVSLIKIEDFSKVYKDVLEGLPEDLIIFDDNNHMAITPSKYPIQPATIHEIIQKEDFNKMQISKIEGKNYAIGIVPLEPLNWYIASVLPMNQTTQSIRSLFIGNIGLYIVMGILLILWIVGIVLFFIKVRTKIRLKDKIQVLRKHKDKVNIKSAQQILENIEDLEVLIERKDIAKTKEYIDFWKNELTQSIKNLEDK